MPTTNVSMQRETRCASPESQSHTNVELIASEPDNNPEGRAVL